MDMYKLRHLEVATKNPEHCSVCGATAEKAAQYEASQEVIDQLFSLFPVQGYP